MSLTQIANAQPPKLNGKRYWRSLDELAETPQFKEWLHREFPEGASEMLSGSSRRTLLKLMAASLGLAGLIGCRRPEEKILPAARGVEDVIPGKPLHYATAMVLGGRSRGLLVEAHDGRPTKVEGNPNHPDSLGAADVFAQASVLGLYDPDRSKRVLREGKNAKWDEFEAFAGEHFAGDGNGVWVLAEPDPSRSLGAVREHFLKTFPRAKWVEYDPLVAGNDVAGAELAFGERLRPVYDFSQADVILSLDCDFLGVDSPGLRATRDFSRRRNEESMNRLYIAESQFSITGAMADHRFRMRSADVQAFAAELLDEETESELAKDLRAHRGSSLVIAGPRQPAAVHALAYRINEQLGNTGKTVSFIAAESRSNATMAELAATDVKTLIVLGGNPAFTATAELDLSKAGTVIHLGLEDDETAALATWHIPQAHYLESWGDTGESIQQPLIAPLYDGKTAAELVAAISGYEDRRAYDVVRNFWFEKTDWRKALHDGVVGEATTETATPKVRGEAIDTAPPGKGIEAVFLPSASVYDGRFANNGWLQELPDPMTKLTWDNAAQMSAATADELGVANGDVVRLEADGRSIEVPVWIAPGQADSSIALEVGYGRQRCGRVGEGTGHNVYPLRATASTGFVIGVQVTKTGRRYKLVSAQDHHSMEGRPLVREATLNEYKKHPEFAKHAVHHQPLESLYEPHDYSQGYQWGMAIDLNKCNGCNACVVACQAENNIPIVGKKELDRGREMHWLRIDRYYTGEEDNPQAVVQPVACQHCENAPCENVCPVAATVHSPEGLNEMTYNRCVGTRYCSNNCPYKVRRFNFFDWHGEVAESQKMVFNPDVTVRMRGVMEKCNYCVQRIQEKKIAAKADGRRELRDGEIQTACQQTCPAEAIVFGNINDPESKVSQVKKQNRDYAILAELNVKPRTSYQAKLRNPNPELAS